MKLNDGGINIIRDFAKFRKPVSPKLEVVLLICFVLSTVLSSVIIMFKDAIKNRYTK